MATVEIDKIRAEIAEEHKKLTEKLMREQGCHPVEASLRANMIMLRRERLAFEAGL